MFKKRCNSCEKKVDRKFHYCPWCGNSLKKKKQEDFGMLGQSDEAEQQVEPMKLPFGLNGIMNGLIKQIEKEMGNMQGNSTGMPKGFKIQISTGNPQIKQINEEQPSRKSNVQTIAPGHVDEKEKSRRSNLERVEAKSIVRRLPEGIFYEIETPGVKSISDVVITKLEESMEIKVYSKDRCYIKTLPLKLEIVSFSVKNDKVLLRLKG